ncbi:hypothetical protein KSF78_0002642 [Schistosoma japonicum]|nr:hypothetical protein KSF78_0002642 [Schistosoma japonicum]
MLCNKQKHILFYVEIGIILLTGLGGLFALISICVRGSWISQRFFDQVHIHTNPNNLIISLLSSVSVWADFLCHLPHELGTNYHFKESTYHPNKQSVDHKRLFISQSNINKTRVSIVPTMIHLLRNYSFTNWIKPKKNLFYSKQTYFNGNYLFGWAYWFCVASVVFLFLSNLIYLMRKDCENKHSIEIV